MMVDDLYSDAMRKPFAFAFRSATVLRPRSQGAMSPVAKGNIVPTNRIFGFLRS